MFQNGQLPEDGFKGSTKDSGYRFVPDLLDGQRLSGTITVHPKPTPPDIPYRMLVDGIPQPGNTIDTTQWDDGSHVIQFQVVDPMGLTVHNGSKVVVINNSGIPYTEKTGQCVVGQVWHGTTPNSLAWARTDVTDPVSQPLNHREDKIVIADDDAKRDALAAGGKWWIDGLSHQPTSLWKCNPILMKNADGDYFIKQFNPQGGGSGNTAENAEPYVRCAPKFDGPRGIGNVSPYCTMNPYLDQETPWSGFDWIGVDKAGRVFIASKEGEIKTILGPRSVAGQVQTDNDLLNYTMEDRIADGEMEYVGDDNGQPLQLPHDIWPCSSFPFEGIIADKLNDCVTEIHFTEQRLMRRWALPQVTSVWDSAEIQQQYNIIWVAVNNEGLWCQRHIVAEPGTNPNPSGGPDGSFVGHMTTLEKLADIPNAFWVRGLGHRIFVITKDLGVYEYDVSTATLTERVARKSKDETYVFGAVDENGSIGPIGRIYLGSTSYANGGWGSSKVAIFWLDIDTFEQGVFSKSAINRLAYGNWTAWYDPFGHYVWGFAIHPTLPICLGYGITSSSPFIWTGYLGEQPIPDLAPGHAGSLQYWDGNLDQSVGFSAVVGIHCGGLIGYSADQWANYQNFTEAKVDMLAYYADWFSSELSDEDKELVCKQIFAQRTRPRFWDALPPQTYTLSLNITGLGEVYVDPNKPEYDAGEIVTITAAPATGWLLESLNGGQDSPILITMNSDQYVNCVFVEEAVEPPTLEERVASLELRVTALENQ